MELSSEQVRWLVKVFQPERSVASLPGGEDGIHFMLEGQKRIALEVVRDWSALTRKGNTQ